MYRVEKVLNHNAVIAIHDENHGEYLLMGKGIGFGKKINERMETRDTDTVYSLQESMERGDSEELAKSISPVCLEVADEVLRQSEKTFGRVDRNMLFPMADHIEYAVKRIQNHEQIRNPLTDDIRVLFHAEYKTAMCIQSILQERLSVQMDEDEAMQMAQAVRQCVALVEDQIGKPIDVLSLSYNRLMNHIRYMVVRALKGEELKVSMNDYMELKFPQSFSMARIVCDQVSHDLRCQLSETEIGYLAMHIERVTSAELDQTD